MSKLLLKNDVTIARLREWLPEWEWSAEHYGMGYRYVGQLANRTATVYAVGIIVGPLEDDIETSWRVDCDGETRHFSAWVMGCL